MNCTTTSTSSPDTPSSAPVASDLVDTQPKPSAETGNLLDVALHYLAAGRSVLPIAPGSKKPSYRDPWGGSHDLQWKPFQSQRVTEEHLRLWFSTGHLLGLGIACGPVSGGQIDGVQYALEVIDIDDEETLDRFMEAANWQGRDALLARLLHQRTPGGAGHFAYCCSEITGNAVLARRPGEPGEPQAVTLIETRGTGGQVVVAPTPPGIHPEHPERGYELVRGSWEDLQVITPEERQALFELARSFNSYVANVKSPIPTGAGQPRANSERPGDLLNSTADREWWRALLEPRGWTLVHQQGDIDYWRRPGKEDKSWSATLGACGPLFYVFSSNAVPFEADRGYQPFTAYALLEHGGDFKAAAMAIAPPRQRANSHTRAATDTAAGRAPTAPPLQPDQSPTSCADDDYPYGDAYNALALVRAHRQDLRYCAAWKSWLTWIGTHWERDTTGRVMRWQRQTVQALGAALPDMDKDDAKALLTHIKSSLNTSRLKAAIEQAPSWEGISNSRRSINPSKHAILLPGFS